MSFHYGHFLRYAVLSVGSITCLFCISWILHCFSRVYNTHYLKYISWLDFLEHEYHVSWRQMIQFMVVQLQTYDFTSFTVLHAAWVTRPLDVRGSNFYVNGNTMFQLTFDVMKQIFFYPTSELIFKQQFVYVCCVCFLFADVRLVMTNPSSNHLISRSISKVSGMITLSQIYGVDLLLRTKTTIVHYYLTNLI